MSWVRGGECNRCGACCEGDVASIDQPAKIHGWCPLYDIIDGLGTCTNRNHPYYLGGCNVFPDHPRIPAKYPTCSYSFTFMRDDDQPYNPYSWEGWGDEFMRFGANAWL